MTAALEASGIGVHYDGKTAVSDVSVTVGEREIVTLIGHNGAGKSSLLNALHGHVPASGQVLFNGQDISRWNPVRRLKAGVALVPQGHQVFAGLSVKENLMIAGLLVGNDTKKDLKRIFELFPILEERAQQQAGTLSGGQQQMLAIGMGLIVEPQLLLIDEPSIGLAPSLVKRVMESIALARDQRGCAILLVEQNVTQSFAIADRVYGMRRGSVVAEAPPETFADTYELMDIM